MPQAGGMVQGGDGDYQSVSVGVVHPIALAGVLAEIERTKPPAFCTSCGNRNVGMTFAACEACGAEVPGATAAPVDPAALCTCASVVATLVCWREGVRCVIWPRPCWLLIMLPFDASSSTLAPLVQCRPSARRGGC